MKKFSKTIALLLSVIMAVSAFTLVPTQKVEAKTTVNSVVKNARNYYNNTNKQIKKKKFKKASGPTRSWGYEEWWSGRKLRKAITYSGYTNIYVKGYTVEYYYDKNLKLVFAFAYRKVNGKVQEHRCYYSASGKLYRYIDHKKKVKNYTSGKTASKMPSIPRMLYQKGTHYVAIAYH